MKPLEEAHRREILPIRSQGFPERSIITFRRRKKSKTANRRDEADD